MKRKVYLSLFQEELIRVSFSLYWNLIRDIIVIMLGYVWELVLKLVDNKKTIATMESCTGGAVANAITNVPGASEILLFSCVTYSNEFKKKMGVSSEVIDKYSVYSSECADEMSLNISKFAHSDFGIGVTGKLKRSDKENMHGNDDIVYISIFDRENNKYHNDMIRVTEEGRRDNKYLVVDKVIKMLK